MATKSFPKSVQTAASKCLPLWQFVAEASGAGIQQFVRSSNSSSLKQLIDFQKGSGDYFYVNYWTVYSGVGKGGTAVDYSVSGGDRLTVSLNGGSVEQAIESSAQSIQSTADQYARKYMAEAAAIDNLMTSIMSEYKDWRQNMPSELVNLESWLKSRLSVDKFSAQVDADQKNSSSPYNSKEGLWSDFRSWCQKTAGTNVGMADYFSATPGAAHQLMPYPDRVIENARFAHFHQHLQNRGYLNSEHAGSFLRGFWNNGRPRLKSDFGEDKAGSSECFLCKEFKSRGKFVEKHDPSFGAYSEFVCSKCLK